ncbi:MAG: TetR/AcrR family transcriptional regulator [bacterium]|nr:TetR/AcrR family transcriptional regulator [bacterium]
MAEFHQTGVDGASVSRIAERAGVSRGSFYFHFPTKEHVLLELQLSLEVPIASQLRRTDQLREALDLFVAGILEAQEKVGDARLFADMLRIHTRRNDDLPVSDRLLVFDALVECFVRGAARGELKRGLDPESAAGLCLTCVFGYLMLNRDSGADRRDELGTLVSLYLEETANRSTEGPTLGSSSQ